MKSKKIIRFFCLLIFFVFLYSYFVENSGYYEYSLFNKKNLTEQQMKEFENDVREGREIDLSHYLEDTRIDYSNKLTHTISDVSLDFNDYLKRLIGNVFKVLKKLVE